MSPSPPMVVTLLTTAGQLASFRLQLQRYEELAQAVAHGMAIGHQAHCLMAARWEEGWERSISDWRLELGINDPADGAAYGLACLEMRLMAPPAEPLSQLLLFDPPDIRLHCLSAAPVL